MEEQQQKNWFKRNWLWFVPTMGCLTLIILFVLGIIGVFSLINNSESTHHAIEVASKNTKVIELLGVPIEKYGIPSGEISYSTDDGNEVDFRIPIKGPKGNATLVVKGVEENGVWDYEKLYVTIKETNERINLLDKSLEGN